MSVFSERLKHLRDERKKENSMWTQEYVADKIRVSRVTYTAYELGTKQPPMETVKRIAELFNTTTDYLHGRTDIEEDVFKEVSNIIDLSDDNILHKKLLFKGQILPDRKAKKAIQIFRQVLQIEDQEEDH